MQATLSSGGGYGWIMLQGVWGGGCSLWIRRYKNSIAGSLSWLSEAEHVLMSFRSMKPIPHMLYIHWVLYGLLAVALYIYHIYYNNTLFTLFFTILHFQLSSM